MFNLNPILEGVITFAIALISSFLVPWFKEKMKSEKLAKAFKIAEQVVYAAWELDITGELVEMGLTKVEYSWSQAKKILAQKNITVDDDELKAYIKGEVAKLRITRGDRIIAIEE